MSSHVDEFGEASYLNPLKAPSNPLLVRPEVGKVMRPTIPLPPKGHVYGQVQEKDKEGAKEVIHHWVYSVPDKKKAAGRDFMRLNRNAAASGCTDAKKVKEFRKGNNALLRVGPLRKKKDLKGNFEPASEKGFGWSNKEEHEPIADIVNGTYQRDWVRQRKEAVEEQKAQRVQAKKKSIEPPATKASAGHRRKQEPETKAPFKLKEFSGVKSKVREMRKAGSKAGEQAGEQTE